MSSGVVHMSDVKRNNGPAGLHAHAKRDYFRGYQTKNMIKGAGGGARGVDFQDFEAENKDKDANTPKSGQQQQAQGSRKKSTAEHKQEQHAGGAIPENIIAEMLASQQQQKVDAAVNEISDRDPDHQKKKQQQQQQHQEQPEQDTPQTTKPEETWQAPAPAANVDVAPANDPVHHQAVLSSIAKMLADPNLERQVYGAFSMTQPEHMKKTLGTPVRVAKHLLVLSSRMLEKGDPRPGVVEYLAGTFLALGPEFGRRAFKDFSVNIGIGSIYPLEVREKLIALNEGFLPTMKCRFTASKRVLQAKVKQAIVLEYPEDMIIKEFAVKGGTRQGYQLAPLKEKGKHGLRFFVPGTFAVLLLGTDAMGMERLEEIKVEVAADAAAVAAPAAAALTVPTLGQRPKGSFFEKIRQERAARERGGT